MRKLERLIQLGNTAKDCGAYQLANEVFASVLFSMKETGAHPNGMVGVETYCGDVEEWCLKNAQDPDGNGYYDLPFVSLYGLRLCIPLPLLSAAAISFISSLKTLGVHEREVHNRRPCRLNPEKSNAAERDLRRRVKEIVIDERLEESRLWGLRETHGIYGVVPRNVETQVHAGVGFRPSQDVFLSLDKDGNVVLRQVVRNSKGQSVHWFELGVLLESQYTRLLKHTPAWVWGLGLYSDGYDKYWYKAVQWAKDGDFAPLWTDMYPAIVDSGITTKLVISIADNDVRNPEYANYMAYSMALDARIVGTPESWPDSPVHRVRWSPA